MLQERMEEIPQASGGAEAHTHHRRGEVILSLGFPDGVKPSPRM